MLTRALGHDAHQALHRLQQLALLALQEAGVAAGGAQAALKAGEGAALASQQAPQPLLLAAEAGQLRLLLRLQGLHPRLQRAAGRGRTGVNPPSPPCSHTRGLSPGPGSETQTHTEAQSGSVPPRVTQPGGPCPQIAQSEEGRKERPGIGVKWIGVQ